MSDHPLHFTCEMALFVWPMVGYWLGLMRKDVDARALIVAPGFALLVADAIVDSPTQAALILVLSLLSLLPVKALTRFIFVGQVSPVG